ncbi:MAG: hypothetical protein KatS3mg081_0793 [Gemmatimonadales bacterium]|nr:MAG: hypothetical protein KatS3mg081_0793 [Gemmatimonadales bacterium]
MEIAAGTSGYAYKEWKGSFYPATIRNEEMLGFYARHFSAVEINNTFYRMPTEKLLLDWSERVPENFSFALKAPQKITHYKRLKDAGEDLNYFFRTCTVLGRRLGPTLFQLPPGFKKDIETLAAFASSLPRRWIAALEFRHPSWFDEETYAILREHNLALCAADTGQDPVRLVLTADFGYLRLRRESYDDSQLAEWVRRVLDQPWRKAYVFFKHEEAGAGPRLAKRFLELANR